MLDPGVLVVFVPAALALAVSPGPDSIYTLTRSVSDGRRAGVMAAAGTTTGSLVHTTAAVLGLSVVFRTSALAFTAVKVVGAGYLVYLGIRTALDRGEFEVAPESAGRTPAEAYRRALAINVLNPKVAVFFLAFLPQFVRPGGSFALQVLALGVLFAALGFCYQALLAVFASRARRVLAESDRVRDALRYASGSVLVGFGVRLALEERGA